MTKTKVNRTGNYEKDKANLFVYKIEGGYRVKNLRTNSEYFVTKNNGQITCTCPDHQNRGTICKHQVAILDWNKAKKRQELDNKFTEIMTRAYQTIKLPDYLL